MITSVKNSVFSFCLLALTILTSNITQAAEKPNILFCIADDASFPHMGANGCSWVKTPGFDRVAKEGIRFTRCYTPNAKCAPSRACILTGRNSWQLEEAVNHWCMFPPKFQTYVEALSSQGYFAGMTAKGWAPGIALDENGKRRKMTGEQYNKRKQKSPTKKISNNDYSANFKDFLDANENGKPWCFWYGSTEPHRAYEYGTGVSKGGKSIDDIERVPKFWPDTEAVRNDMLDYAFEIEHFDSHLVKMLDELEKRGELDNTLILVTSDNGMPFPRIKGQEYEYSNHLPLAIMWKNGIKKPGRVFEDYVNFIDFAPTFLEMAEVKIDNTKMQSTQGQSLMPIFNSGDTKSSSQNRDHVLIGKERHDIGRPNDWGYPIRGIVKNDILFLHNFEPTRWPVGNPVTGYLNTDGGATKTEILEYNRAKPGDYIWQLNFGKRFEKELYDVKNDPECMDNLINHPKYQKLAIALEKQMEAELKLQKDPRMFGKGHILEGYKYQSKGTVDFYNRFMKGEKMNAGWVNESDFEKEDPK